MGRKVRIIPLLLINNKLESDFKIKSILTASLLQNVLPLLATVPYLTH